MASVQKRSVTTDDSDENLVFFTTVSQLYVKLISVSKIQTMGRRKIKIKQLLD